MPLLCSSSEARARAISVEVLFDVQPLSCGNKFRLDYTLGILCQLYKLHNPHTHQIIIWIIPEQ